MFLTNAQRLFFKARWRPDRKLEPGGLLILFEKVDQLNFRQKCDHFRRNLSSSVHREAAVPSQLLRKGEVT